MAKAVRKRAHHITRHDIIEMMNKNDSDLLECLNRTGFGFSGFLKKKEYYRTEKTMDHELVELVIEASSRICTIRRQNALGSILKYLRTLAEAEHQHFIFYDAVTVIHEFLDHKTSIYIASYLKHYLIILKCMMKNKIGAKLIADYTYPSLQNILNCLKTKNIKDLQESLVEFEKLKKEVERYEKPAPESEEDDDEFGTFRELSIVPKDNDIVNVILPDLPCNKIDGPYNSVDHYLSVHFRLMREDMIRSFRDCIRMCENPNEAAKSGCRIYESVTAKYPPVFVPEGICYAIEIRNNTEMNLAKGNPLMVGNMVCLTPDEFNTVYFAVLTKQAKAGGSKTIQCTTEIRLEEIFEDVLKPDVEYLMFEPNAYFECYKHVLAAILDFDKNNFPLSDFLVFLDFEEPEPEYLTSSGPLVNAKYCLHEKCTQTTKSADSTVLDAESCNREKLKEVKVLQNPEQLKDGVGIENGEIDGTELKSARIFNNLNGDGGSSLDDCKEFQPLHFNDWPSALDLGLDDQQLEAFKTALTKKVAVIQGPPGTGKTYLGVKVVKALLENVPLTPIVICCLTNHALDQFLEHIRKFTKKIIRLGSQSKSSVIEPHTLDNLTMTCIQNYDKNSHSLVTGTFENSYNILKKLAPELLTRKQTLDTDDIYLQLRTVCNELNLHFRTLKLCQDKYLDDGILNQIFNKHLKEQLREGSSTHSKALSTSVLEWLCCSRTSVLYEQCNLRFQQLKTKPFNRSLYEYQNPWKLELSKRYLFFYNLRNECLLEIEGDIELAKNQYKDLLKEYMGKKPDSLKIDILKSACVIGVTTTGAAKYRSLIRYTNPAILVVEEAAEVLESHIIASLTPSIKHLILIGDHKQLRPLPANHELSEIYNLKISMFERLFKNNAPSATLISQHRMKPCISDLLVHDELYSELKNNENVFEYKDILGVKSSVFFFDHSYSENETSSSTSSSNDYEAKIVVCLAKYLCKQSYLEAQITILATYSAQVPLIQKYLAEEDLNIFVTTVDNYQGEENDIVLISFVRNNKAGKIGFLMENNRVNVALSRAKKGMYCFGNFSLYAQKSVLWKRIVEKLEPQNMIGPKLPLQCNKHFKETLVESSEEILTLIQRGCSEKCGFDLLCGHKCVRKCHYDDQDHSLYQCPLPCGKDIGENKKCTRMCYERCKNIKKLHVNLPCGHEARQRKDGSIIPDCEVEVQKLLPCKHTDTLPCSTDLSTYKCKASVLVLLPCGHKRSILCHKQNDLSHVACYDMKPVLGPCGHTIDVPCCLDLEEHELIAYCNNSCGILLKCGHPCTGCCSTCSDIGIHALCTMKCDKVLDCSHKCHGYCASPCPPCREKCSLTCIHETVCVNFCIRPCVQCNNTCRRGCEHVGTCEKKCYEKCSVTACVQPCREILPCGHKCIGFCGDPCPYLCRICNREDLDSGDPMKDYYIELEECNHVIEAKQLDEHVNTSVECYMWPDCPVCKQPIRKSLRYKTILLQAKINSLSSNDNSEEIEDIHYHINSLCPPNSVIPSEFIEVESRITTILNEIKPTSGTLLVLKHCIIALGDMIFINSKLKKTASPKREHLQNRFDTLLTWISNHLKFASYQQLDELDIQVDKLKREF